MTYTEVRTFWRPFVFIDSFNEKAIAFAKEIQSYPIEQANIIYVVGGDGTMIKAVKQHHKANLPFYGINYGHLGFLLNKGEIQEKLNIYALPMLMIDFITIDGKNGKDYAVNDIWVERASAQTAKLEVFIDDHCVLPRLFADGLLVCTPQGSTAYARAMGGTPLPLDTKALQIVGSNVSFPSWKSALIGLSRMVSVHNHDLDKRPIQLYSDGVCHGLVSTVCVYVSYSTRFQLAFDPAEDLDMKITNVQFPKQ